MEIRKLQSKVSERGWTIVPLSMYLSGGRAKVEIALVRGKRLYDKRTPWPSGMPIERCNA
jgi:SsrA-binding protein